MNSARDPAFHPATYIFPFNGDNLSVLADLISRDGQQSPIDMLDGAVIHGRRRLRACILAGVPPVTRVVRTSDPVMYVLGAQLADTHMTASQAAMAAARAIAYYVAEVPQRRNKFGGKRPDRLPARCSLRDIAGYAFGISGKMVGSGKHVLQHGSDELIAAVEQGAIAVTAAAELLREPLDVQQVAIVAATNSAATASCTTVAGKGGSRRINLTRKRKEEMERLAWAILAESRKHGYLVSPLDIAKAATELIRLLAPLTPHD